MERGLYVHLVIHANQNIHRVRKGRNVTIGWDRNFLASYWNLGGHRHVPLSHATSKSFPFPSLPSSYHFTLRTSNSESAFSWQRLCLSTACLRDRRKATWQRSHQRDTWEELYHLLFSLSSILPAIACVPNSLFYLPLGWIEDVPIESLILWDWTFAFIDW